MSPVRHLIVAFGFGIGFWVLASFTGAMLDPAHAEPWTTSLMWSLLASTLVAPAFLMAYHHARTDTAETTPFIKETPSVGEGAPSERQTASWPEPQAHKTRSSEGHEDTEDWPQMREDVGPMQAA